ncbi:hypothetical protein PG990_010513 [Apiospora arundinis]
MLSSHLDFKGLRTGIGKIQETVRNLLAEMSTHMAEVQKGIKKEIHHLQAEIKSQREVQRGKDSFQDAWKSISGEPAQAVRMLQPIRPLAEGYLPKMYKKVVRIVLSLLRRVEL